MKLSDFDYKYPEDLVAQRPLPKRDQSRMLVADRKSGKLTHSIIIHLPDFLKAGDLLVVNNSKVFPARLFGKKESGSKIEFLLLEDLGKNRWRAISNRKKRLKENDKIVFGPKLCALVMENREDDIIIGFESPNNILEEIEKTGLPPLPPYIKRKGAGSYTAEDRERYQTIYAKHTGSAAAPTAGFHLTDKIIKECRSKGVCLAEVTLHVGLDTFSPVRSEEIEKHKMHGENFLIPDETIKAIQETKQNGGKIIAVGTTTVRALESFWANDRIPETGSRRTELFIYPGYKFRVVDQILTNFHQPKSTLIIMISAFAGREFVLNAYAEAIKNRYRLFSYGDSMFIK